MSAEEPPRTEAKHGTSSARLDSSIWEKPKTHKAIYIGLLLGCSVLLVADLLYSQHGHFPYEEITAFHAGFGFLAYVAIVSTAKLLRRLVGRAEDYYGE